jgi:hypothetical protein
MLFRTQLRLGDSDRERRLAAMHLSAASIERQRAVSEWAAAQTASQLGLLGPAARTGQSRRLGGMRTAGLGP